MAKLQRRRRGGWFALSLLALVLVLAASWFGWGREGLAPVDPASPQADKILELYLVLGLVAASLLLSRSSCPVMAPVARRGRLRARRFTATLGSS